MAGGIPSIFSLGGSSGSSSGSSTFQPILPPWFGKYGVIGTEANQLEAGLNNGGIPSVANLIQNFPQQGVAPLTPDQNQDIGAIQALANNPFGLTPEETAAAQRYNTAGSIFRSLAGGGPAAGFSANVSGAPTSAENQAQAAFNRLLGGPNVAVPYGMNVFNQTVAPQVESQMALAGLGNSGAAGEDLGIAGAQMMLPLAQQGLQLEEAGAQGLAGLGEAEQGNAINAGLGSAGLNLQALGIRTGAMEAAGSGETGIANAQANLGENQWQQGVSNLSNALQAAGIPQAEAQAILNAAYQQRMGQTQLGADAQRMMASWLPAALTGSQTTNNSSQSGSNWNLGPF